MRRRHVRSLICLLLPLLPACITEAPNASAVRLAADTVPPATAPDCWKLVAADVQQKVDGLIAQLADPDYRVRDAASAQLATYCPDQCMSAYLDYRRGTSDAEVSERLRVLAVKCNDGCELDERQVELQARCRYDFPVTKSIFPAAGTKPECSGDMVSCVVSMRVGQECSLTGTPSTEILPRYTMRCPGSTKTVFLVDTQVPKLSQTNAGCEASMTLTEPLDAPLGSTSLTFAPTTPEFRLCPEDGTACTEDLSEELLEALQAKYTPYPCWKAFTAKDFFKGCVSRTLLDKCL